MREDIIKCVTEPERRGSWQESKKYGGKVRQEDSESTYDKEFGGLKSSSTGKQYGWDSKSAGLQLSPIEGALRKNLGRPWDKVYSEFCDVKFNSKKNNINRFLKWNVCTNCFMQDGKVMEFGRWGLTPTEVDGFYVHPKTGILCYKQREKRKHKLQPITKIKYGEVTYELIGGFKNKQGQDVDPKWFSGIYKMMPRQIYRSKIDPETKTYKGYYETVMELQYTDKKSCNKKDLQIINDYLAEVEKIRRRKAS